VHRGGKESYPGGVSGIEYLLGPTGYLKGEGLTFLAARVCVIGRDVRDFRKTELHGVCNVVQFVQGVGLTFSARLVCVIRLIQPGFLYRGTSEPAITSTSWRVRLWQKSQWW
jgi:hypothetical protein